MLIYKRTRVPLHMEGVHYIWVEIHMYPMGLHMGVTFEFTPGCNLHPLCEKAPSLLLVFQITFTLFTLLQNTT